MKFVGSPQFLTPFSVTLKSTKDGQAAPKGIDSQLVTRVAMGVDVLARLHQQIQLSRSKQHFTAGGR